MKDDYIIVPNNKPPEPNSHYHIEFLPVRKPKALEETLEGREVITVEEAQKRALESLNGEDQVMSFGGISINTKTNVAYSGLTQFGKTSVMKLHMAEVLRRIKDGSDEKVILYNASGELIPFVYAQLGDAAPVFILNPSDSRCRQWNICKDAEGAATINDISHTLVREKEYDTPFFTEGAQSLIGGVMDAFYLTEVKENVSIDWTLKDVACAVKTPQRIKAVLEPHWEYLGHIVESFLNRSNQDVYSSVSARFKELAIVASMWDGREKFSLLDFFDSEKGGVLILAADEKNKATVNELNRLIIERAGKIIGKRDIIPFARYWFFLDEFQELGKTGIIKQLIKDGLKRGIRIHISCQNFEDVRETYGEKAASVLFSECGSHYIFRQGTKESAEHSARIIGDRRLRRWTRNSNISWGCQEGYSHTVSKTTSNSNTESTSWNKDGYSGGRSATAGASITVTDTHTKSESIGASQGLQEQIVTEPVVSTGEFQNLPVGTFYAVTPSVSGTWKHCFEWREIEAVVMGESKEPSHAKFIKRNEKLLGYLADWTPGDLERLRLSGDVVKEGAAPRVKKDEENKREHEQERPEGLSLQQMINGRFGQ